MARPPVNSVRLIRWPEPPKRNSIPWWTRPSRRSRSPTPDCSSRSTLPCSSTPARTRCSTWSRLRLSTITDSMPCRCKRCESSSPAGPAPTMPTCVRSFKGSGAYAAGALGAAVHFSEHVLRHVKCGVGRGHTAIDRALQDHFLDLVARHAIVEGGTNVHPEFVAAVDRDHERQRDQAARVTRKPGARPDFAPGVAGDEVLEFLVERVPVRNRAVHVRVAQHGAAELRTFGMAVTVIHQRSPERPATPLAKPGLLAS